MYENSRLEWPIDGHYIKIKLYVFQEHFTRKILKEWVGIDMLPYWVRIWLMDCTPTPVAAGSSQNNTRVLPS